MLVRERTEKREKEFLSPYAVLVAESRGRRFEEEKDPIRTDFQRDRDRIIYSKAFRRLKRKTQVFISPWGDHYRTRLTHTLEVAQIGRTIARALQLNEDLVEAMAMGHDVGHTPFGHAGEAVMQELVPGFSHAAQSVRVLEYLELRGKDHHYMGLNLTEEVLDGIRNHSGDKQAFTLEGRLLKMADRIAYVNHDIDDSIRGGILTEEALPRECTEVLGHSSSDRIDSMVNAVIRASQGKPVLTMEEPFFEASRKLRAFMFESVYTNVNVKSENRKLGHIMADVFAYYMDHPNQLPASHRQLYAGELADEPLDRVVADYIAGMSDQYLIWTFEDLFIPEAWKKM